MIRCYNLSWFLLPTNRSMFWSTLLFGGLKIGNQLRVSEDIERKGMGKNSNCPISHMPEPFHICNTISCEDWWYYVIVMFFFLSDQSEHGEKAYPRVDGTADEVVRNIFRFCFVFGSKILENKVPGIRGQRPPWVWARVPRGQTDRVRFFLIGIDFVILKNVLTEIPIVAGLNSI